MKVTLKDLHRCSLIIAKEVKRICEKHDIKYFLLAGTALGAVRHKGFIPWDDDMDIGMLRKDYEKFLRVCKSELKKEFFLQTWDTEEDFPFSFAKVRLNNTMIVESFSENANIHKGIFIDIFPLDNAPNNKFQAKIQGYKYFIIKRLLWIKKGMGQNIKGYSLKDKIKFNTFRFISLFFNYKSLKKYFYKIQTKYNNIETQKIVADGSYVYSKESFCKKYTDNLIPIKFENVEFNIFADYDEYLTHLYGDYMQLPPEDKRGGHFAKKIELGKYKK